MFCFVFFCYEKTDIFDVGISCFKNLSEKLITLGQNPKVTAITLSSCVFKRVVTPLLERNYVYKYIWFWNELSFLSIFAFT